MKTIGLLGGMSWESTTSYYRLINQLVKERRGGLHSAEIILYSVDFDPIEKLQHQGRWLQTQEILTRAARSIEDAGADFLLICTNTMHKVAEGIEQALSIPLLHIADATAKRLQRDGVRQVGLLGTGFTMEEDFYKGRLTKKYGIEVLIPKEKDRRLVHQVIYEELCLGTIKEKSKTDYLQVVERLQAKGAQAVILGCTEIALLIGPDDTNVPLYDTTAIHAAAAVDLALSL